MRFFRVNLAIGHFLFQTVTWKGTELEQLGTGQLSKVWVPCAEQSQSLPAQAASWRRRSGSVPLSITPYGRGVGDGGERGRGEGVRSRWRESGNVGRRGRQLLSSLLRLVSPHWVGTHTLVYIIGRYNSTKHTDIATYMC